MVRCFYNSYDMCIHVGNYLDNTQVYHVIYIYIHMCISMHTIDECVWCLMNIW